jgi:hypothetical protein
MTVLWKAWMPFRRGPATKFTNFARIQRTRRITKWERFKRWLKRHSQLFTFLVPVVVLGTFLTRDLALEFQRDLSNAIENAENIFSVRQDFSVIFDQLSYFISR